MQPIDQRVDVLDESAFPPERGFLGEWKHRILHRSVALKKESKL
jgi:hypothetical protein